MVFLMDLNLQDIFTALYSSAPVSVPGWQRGPYPGIGYGMQYPMGMVCVVALYFGICFPLILS